jgi:hypothetical protein
MISESKPQPSHQGWQLTQLINEINAVLAQANIVPTTNQSNQLAQALSSLYGYDGEVPQQLLNNIITAAGTKLPNSKIATYYGSNTAPGTVLLSNCPRGEYLTSGYFADSPLGSSVNSYGIIVTGNSGPNNFPSNQTLADWFYQEWFDMTAHIGLKRGTRYFRTNIDGENYGDWNSQHQSNLGNMFGYIGPDIILPVGQSVQYDTGEIPVASLPLHISCLPNQLYELEVIHRYPIVLSPSSYPIVNAAHTQLNLDLALLPNNTSYLNSFTAAGIETQANYYNTQGQIYNVANPSAGAWNNTTSTGQAYPNTVAGNYVLGYNIPMGYNNFWFDDIDGTANPPYIRKILIYTGDQNNLPTGFHVGGGGSDSYQAGVNTSIAVWSLYNQIGYYTSLGTLFMQVGGQNSFLVSVRRII